MNVKRISKSIPAVLLLMVLMLVPFAGASRVLAQEDDFIPDLCWNYASSLCSPMPPSTCHAKPIKRRERA